MTQPFALDVQLFTRLATSWDLSENERAVSAPRPPQPHGLPVNPVRAGHRRHRLATGQRLHDLLHHRLCHHRVCSEPRLLGTWAYATLCHPLQSACHHPAPAVGVGSLRRSLPGEFHTIADSQTVTVDALDAWMSTDAHIYAPKHLRPALRLMEGEGRLTLMTPADCLRRGLTYPKEQGYAITFTA